MKSTIIAFFAFLFVALCGAVVTGWIMNIVDLVNASGFGTLELVRIIGIFLVPLGAGMGWFA